MIGQFNFSNSLKDTHTTFNHFRHYSVCLFFLDGKVEERGATEAGGSFGVADRENVAEDGDITTKDTRGGITRRTGHSEEKTDGQHQRPHQAAHAGLAAQIIMSFFIFHFHNFSFTFIFRH